MQIKEFKKFSDVEEHYKILSEFSLPYWRYESIKSKMKSIKYKFQFPALSWIVVYDDTAMNAILIAPLYVHKKEKIVRLLGDVGYNICDFVYKDQDEEIIYRAIITLLLYFKEQVFKTEFKIKWWYMSEESLSYHILIKLQTEGFLNFSYQEAVKNTKIEINNNYEEYFKSLSKHVRQNVRTAYNRVARDGFEIKFNLYEDYSFNPKKCKEVKTVFERYMNVYTHRQNRRYKNGIKKIAKGILIKYFKYDYESAFYSFSMLADITINGEVAAMAKCHKDLNQRQIIIPMLAINEDLYTYSPGIILVNELAKYVSASNNINCISLGRGDEKYKYDMGGINYTTNKCIIEVF